MKQLFVAYDVIFMGCEKLKLVFLELIFGVIYKADIACGIVYDFITVFPSKTAYTPANSIKWLAMSNA